jgi:Flp pilus assembly protein TadG
MEQFQTKRRLFRSGNAVLETALVLPILLLLSMGMIEFGHFFLVKHNIQAAVRQATRKAITPSVTSSEVEAEVKRVMTQAGIPEAAYKDHITLVPSDMSTATPGSHVSVTVSCLWSDVGLRPLHLIDGGKSVSAKAEMLKEGQ